MHLSQRHSLFPLAIIVLSLVLAGFMLWSLQDRSASSIDALEALDSPPSLDASAYREELSRVVATFDEAFAVSSDDATRSLAVQTALSALLALRVPSEHKDLHLALAVALHQLSSALDNDADTAEPLRAIAQVEVDNPWLSP